MPTVRVDGKIVKVGYEDLTPLEAEKLARELLKAAQEARGGTVYKTQPFWGKMKRD